MRNARLCLLVLLSAVPLSGQTISTYAGGGNLDGQAATAIPLLNPYGAAIDSAGNIYFSEREGGRVRRIDAATGKIRTVAGNGGKGFSGDGGPATSAALNDATGLAIDTAGNLFIADSANGRVRMVDAVTGDISTYAGGGTPADGVGDGGPATSASFGSVWGLAFDAAGDLYVGEFGERVRKISKTTHVITTVAGNGQVGFGGDGGPATAAKFDRPIAMAIDAAGNLYIADAANNRVRKVDAQTKTITTVAGNGTTEFGTNGGDGGQATAASLNYPTALLLDPQGRLLVADTFHRRVRRVDLASGIITTIGGNGDYGGGDGMPATQAGFIEPRGLVFDPSGALVVSDYTIRKIAAGTTIVSTIAGGGSSLGDGGPATSGLVYNPYGIGLDAAGNLFIADALDSKVRRVSAATKTITTVAGSGVIYFDGEGRPATETAVGFPSDVKVDAQGNVFISDPYNDRVYRVDSGGILHVHAGGGDPPDRLGDGGPATSAYFVPDAIALDAAGNLFICDRAHHRIRKVAAGTGTISTVAGIDAADNGTGGFAGDGGLATAARLSYPNGLAFDAAGNIYISDNGNGAIRKITAADGKIQTIAGRGNPNDGLGDGDVATAAFIRGPRQIAFDKDGNLLLVDSNRVRKVDRNSTIITTIAGSDLGFLGDGGTPTAARFAAPWGLAVNAAGDVFVGDEQNNRVRVISAGGGCPLPTITTPPASTTVVTGQATVLTVSAAGSGALSYQWYEGTSGDVSRPVSGAVSSSLTTPPLTTTTRYWVRVTNSCGHVDSTTATVTVSTTLADLAVQMSTSADVVAVGTSLTFTVTARNNGPTTATGLKVTDTPPPGATLVSVTTSQGTCSGTGPIVCAAGSVVPGASVLVTLVFRPQSAGTVTNRARVDANETDPNPDDNTAARDVVAAAANAADVYVQMTHAPEPPRAGQQLTFTLFVGNAGPGPATALSLTTTLPAGATLSSVDPRQGSCSGTGPVTCALGSLPPGGSTTVTLVVIPVVGQSQAVATVTHTEPDPVSYNDVSDETITVLSNQAECPAHAPAILSSPEGVVRAGDTFTISWSDVYGTTDANGTYRAQLANASDFGSGSILASVQTRSLDLSFPTTPGTNATLFFRVTSIAGCGTPGGTSPTVAINVAPNPPAVVVTQEQDPPWVVRPGEAPPAATIRFKNIGGATAAVQFRAVSDTSFFTFTPTTAVLAPGAETTVTVTSLAGASATQGTTEGGLVADYVQGSVSASVSLSVTSTFTPDGKADVDQDEILIVNRPPGARRPEADGLPTVRVVNYGREPIFLVPSISPGGAWLRLDPTDFSTPLGAGESRVVKLTTDATRLTAGDYPLPIWTILSIRAAGGIDPVDVKIFLTNGTAVVPATGRGFLPPSERSFIVPTSVHKSGAGGTLFTSDGWIRNVSPDPAPVDFYVTPSGEDGQSNALLVKQTVPGFGTLRLFDFVQGLFGSTDLAGPVEVRSASFSQLSVRVSASGLPGSGDITSRYGTEIPVYGSGAGTGVGLPSLVLTGIKSTSAFRLNVILAETIGTSARVTLKLYDSGGALLASKLVTVPAAGNTQFPLLDTLGIGSREVEAGSLVVEPSGGSGRVVAIGTLIDNASSSFQSLSGRAFRDTTITRRAGLAAAVAPPRIIPSIVHSSGIGAYFTTEVSITNPTSTPAALHLVYDYSGSQTGTATADVTLGPRASLVASKSRDAVVNLFGLPANSNTAGPMRIEGDGAGLVVARATVTTPVDLSDPSKGVKGSEFQSYSRDSAEAVRVGGTPVVIYPGLQKYPGIRTNLILAEVSGQAATVRVRLVSGTSGGVVGQLDRTLAAYERVQINDIWNGVGGFGVGGGSFDRISFSLEPIGTGGGAVVGALAVIDNLTNSSKILALQPPGPPQASWIGF